MKIALLVALGIVLAIGLGIVAMHLSLRFLRGEFAHRAVPPAIEDRELGTLAILFFGWAVGAMVMVWAFGPPQ